MAVLPAKLENVPDDFLHQFEGLLDLRLNQRGEVNYSHVNLHTRKRNRHSRRSAQSFKLDCKVCVHGNDRKKKVSKKDQVCARRTGKNAKCGEKKCERERFPDKWSERYKRWTKREREVEGSTQWDRRKEAKAQNKMTQHGWLASQFLLPQ